VECPAMTASFQGRVAAQGRHVPPPAPVPAPEDEASPLGRLIQIVRVNEHLLRELGGLNRRLDRAHLYLARPDSNPRFALSCIDHIRQKRSALLAHLRANRIESDQILGTRRAAPMPTPTDRPAIEMN
jgi:hypothetical protein